MKTNKNDDDIPSYINDILGQTKTVSVEESLRCL